MLVVGGGFSLLIRTAAQPIKEEMVKTKMGEATYDCFQSDLVRQEREERKQLKENPKVKEKLHELYISNSHFNRAVLL
jgi:hypothetical protein